MSKNVERDEPKAPEIVQEQKYLRARRRLERRQENLIGWRGQLRLWSQLESLDREHLDWKRRHGLQEPEPQPEIELEHQPTSSAAQHFSAVIPIISWKKGSQTPAVQQPPGSNLRSLAKFLYSKKTFTEVFEPTLDDLQLEYIEALAENQPWKARWIRIRGTYSFLQAAGAWSLVSLLKTLVGFWKAT